MSVMTDWERADVAAAFGLALGQAREEAGITQAALATRMDTTAQRVSDWERGHREPRPADAIALERAVGAEPGSLTIHLGYLPPDAVEVTLAPTVEQALIADKSLDGRWKRRLLEMYNDLTNG